MSTPKATIGQIKRALINQAGIIPLAAQELGMTRQSLHERVNKRPDLKAFAKALTEEVKGVARDNIMSAILSGDLKTSRWYLERVAKDEFGNSVGVRLGDDVIADIIRQVADVGGAAGLRKLADGL